MSDLTAVILDFDGTLVQLRPGPGQMDELRERSARSSRRLASGRRCAPSTRRSSGPSRRRGISTMRCGGGRWR